MCYCHHDIIVILPSNAMATSDLLWLILMGKKKKKIQHPVTKVLVNILQVKTYNSSMAKNICFRINGRKGWGLAEWDFRHHGGRPRAYSVGDPAWTKDLVKG